MGKRLYVPSWYSFGGAAGCGKVCENASSCDEECLERHGGLGMSTAGMLIRFVAQGEEPFGISTTIFIFSQKSRENRTTKSESPQPFPVLRRSPRLPLVGRVQSLSDQAALAFVATHAAHLRSPSFLLTHFTSHGWCEPSHTFMNPLDEELVFCRDGAAVVPCLGC